jgi:hypothetical protein
VKAGAKATLDALTAEGGFVVAERHKGKGVSNADGVAIYFPRAFRSSNQAVTAESR